MSVITIESKAFQIIMNKLNLLEATVKAMSINNGHSRWMEEADVMAVTGLSKSSLLVKRRAGILNWSSATGRKIKYLRRDVEAYLNSNSTFTKKTA